MQHVQQCLLMMLDDFIILYPICIQKSVNNQSMLRPLRKLEKLSCSRAIQIKVLEQKWG